MALRPQPGACQSRGWVRPGHLRGRDTELAAIARLLDGSDTAIAPALEWAGRDRQDPAGDAVCPSACRLPSQGGVLAEPGGRCGQPRQAGRMRRVVVARFSCVPVEALP